MEHQILQSQYNRIYFYFRTTTEPFDFLEWDGKTLKVWNKNKVIEKYQLKDLNFSLVKARRIN